MCFIWLEFALHDNALLEEIGQASHYDGVEHVDLEKEAVSDVVTVEWNALDKSDPGNEPSIFSILIPPVADSQGMINGQMQTIDESAN